MDEHDFTISQVQNEDLSLPIWMMQGTLEVLWLDDGIMTIL